MYWPREQDGCGVDKELYKLLNPSSHLGNVKGTMEERSLVYATGGCDAP